MSFREAQGLEVLQLYRLMQFIHSKDKKMIRKMVTFGLEDLINLTEPKDGLGVLHLAVAADDDDMVSFLLSLGAAPDIQNKKSQTPIMLAAELGNDAIVALLAQNQADMRLLDADGKGVLFYCVHPTRRHNQCLQLAVANQADVNNTSSEGTHIFQLMCSQAKQLTSMCLTMLHAGADSNAKDQETGVTSLMEAAKAGSLELVRDILRKGANVNATDLKRLTAVHYAAIGGFFEVIKVLSAYAADMNVTNQESCTPLHYAAASGNANCCKFLAQRGCNPKVKNLDGLQPHQIAKDSGHNAAAAELKKAEKIKKRSTDVKLMSVVWALNLHDWSNEFETELQRACVDKSDIIKTEMFVSVLKELNAPIDQDQLLIVLSAHDERRQGFINMADFIKGVKYIKKTFLLSSYTPKKKRETRKGGKKKDKIDIPVQILVNPVESMPRRSNGGPAHFMIEKYQSRPSMREQEATPQHPVVNDAKWYMTKPHRVYVHINHCVGGGDFQSLELAFGQGIPVDVQDPFYKTPLMVACSGGNYEMVRYLIKRGADVDVRDQLLWTALHHAADKGETEIVELLVEADASIDAAALDGSTPLMFAIRRSKISCVEVLINAGAHVYAKNKRGQNCMDVAAEVGHLGVMRLVRARMASRFLPQLEPKRRRERARKSSQKKLRTGNRNLEESDYFRPGSCKQTKPKCVALQPDESQFPCYQVTVSIAGDPLQARTLTATSGKSPSRIESKSVLLMYTSIISGKANAVDITFVPEKGLARENLPTASQLLAKRERQRELVVLKEEFDDSLDPLCQRLRRKILELTNKHQARTRTARGKHMHISIT